MNKHLWAYEGTLYIWAKFVNVETGELRLEKNIERLRLIELGHIFEESVLNRLLGCTTPLVYQVRDLCDCGKEKHGFIGHVTGCPAGGPK